ncbi:acyl-CoA dehydrogenase family protein [Myxococcota bacterium]|nr:acyl-CoA dehydrogenase family protein [Myxococcota bacterium]
MDFKLTEEQQMIRDMARSFAEKDVAPYAAEWDEKAEFPTAAVKKMGELGLMGVAVPEAWGGSGMDQISYVIAMEEISAACASTGVIMSVNNSLACDPLLRFGTDAQKARWLKPMASGKILGSFALSEPASGSDAGAAEMTAQLSEDGRYYLVNGTKNFITNGPSADMTIIFAHTDRAKGHKSLIALIADIPTPGLTVGPKENKLGIKAAWCSQLIFEDCKIPVENQLGGMGEGFKVAMSTLDGGRIGIAAQALGIARAAFEAAGRYSLERQAFGKPIAHLQAIQFKLADMATRIDAARLLTLRAASLKDKGNVRYTKAAAMAKLYASETAMWVATQAVQVFGGYGYLHDYPVQRHFRDAKITEIYEGTSEIQRLVIAAATLKELAG